MILGELKKDQAAREQKARRTLVRLRPGWFFPGFVSHGEGIGKPQEGSEQREGRGLPGTWERLYTVLSVSLGSERTQFSWVRAKTSD